jgi:hypothetical protein
MNLPTMNTNNPEVSRHLMTYSDAALEAVLEFLTSNRPEEGWAASWWEERTQAVKREFKRRIEEDAEGER